MAYSDKLTSFKIVALGRSNFSDASIVIRPGEPEQPSYRIGIPAHSLSTKLFQKCVEANKLPSSSTPTDNSTLEVVKALRAGVISGAGLWGPLILRVRGTATEPRINFTSQCKAAEIGLPVFFVMLTDLRSLADHSIQAELANVFAHNGLIRKNPKVGLDDVKRAYAERDIMISDDEARRELLNGLPPRFEEQLKQFDSTNGPSKIETILSALIDEMADAGIIGTKPKPGDLLDPSVLRAIANDPGLRKLATSND
jgi:hypothetical protein